VAALALMAAFSQVHALALQKSPEATATQSDACVHDWS
jgi:hypothetical protein